MGLITKEDIHESLLNSLSNPNLFINGDFRNPVNQREKSQYTSNGYCIDRWKKWTDKFTTSVQNGFLRNQGTWIVLFQFLEESPKLFKKGTVFTMSAKVKCEKTRQVKFSYYDHTSNQSIGEICQEITVGTDWQIISHTVTVNVDIVHQNTSFCIETPQNDNDNATLDIEWIKLELGSVSTPFIPRLYAEELALCQRYYEVGGAFRGIITNSLSRTTFSCEYKFTKRVKPTVTLYAKNTANKILNENTDEVFDYTIYQNNVDGYSCVDVLNSSSNTFGTPFLVERWTSDAEIY